NMLRSGNAFVSVDNHDNQRGHGGDNSVITHKNPHIYKMASAFCWLIATVKSE
ncbi:Alpha-amylase, partial [Caligus rogercresseyi]